MASSSTLSVPSHHQEVERGDWRLVLEARRNGVSWNALRTQTGLPALGVALVNGTADIVARLLEQGASPSDSKMFDGTIFSPLWRVIEQQDNQKLILLLDAGADPNACRVNNAGSFDDANIKQSTISKLPLSHVSEAAWLEGLETLLKYGARPNAPDPQTGRFAFEPWLECLERIAQPPNHQDPLTSRPDRASSARSLRSSSTQSARSPHPNNIANNNANKNSTIVSVLPLDDTLDDTMMDAARALVSLSRHGAYFDLQAVRGVDGFESFLPSSEVDANRRTQPIASPSLDTPSIMDDPKYTDEQNVITQSLTSQRQGGHGYQRLTTLSRFLACNEGFSALREVLAQLQPSSTETALFQRFAKGRKDRACHESDARRL